MSTTHDRLSFPSPGTTHNASPRNARTGETSSRHRLHKQIDHSVKRAVHAPARPHVPVEQIQAESQPRIARHKTEIAAIAATILIASLGLCAGLGSDWSPSKANPRDSQTDSTANGAQATLNHMHGQTVEERLATVATMNASRSLKAELFNAIGVDCLADKHVKEAIRAFKLSLTNDPTFATADDNLAMALVQAGDQSDAKRTYMTALSLQPQNSYASSQLRRLH